MRPPNGSRLVNVVNGVTIHSGWLGELGVVDVDNTYWDDEVNEVMRNLANVMAEHTSIPCPAVTHSMRKRIEEMAAQRSRELWDQVGRVGK